MLLGLDGLMQAVGIAAAGHQTAGELVDDDHLSVLHHVIHVALHQHVGAQRGKDVVMKLIVLRVSEVFNAECLLGLANAFLGKDDRLFLLVANIVLVLALAQTLHEAIRLLIQLGGLVALAGNDQRRARLVDQDRVDLVHDGEVQRPLHHVLPANDHVVAQVIKAQLVVGGIGHVGGIGGLALLRRHVVQNQADLQAHESEDLAHPLAVIFRQIIVHRYDVHALARQRVQIGGQRGRQRFALAGAHLRDATLMQHNRAHQLHAEGSLSQRAVRALAHRRQRVDHQIVQRLALLQPLAEERRLPAQLRVRQRLHLRFLRVDGVDDLHQFSDLRLVRAGENSLKEIKHFFHERYSPVSKSVYYNMLFHFWQ